MMLRTRIVEIKQGRDSGKKFIITEMDAWKAEHWAVRALSGMARAGYNLSQVLAVGAQTLEKLAQFGLASLLVIEQGLQDELSAELIENVELLLPDGTKRKMLTDDIQDGGTLLELRSSAFLLLVDHFTGGSTLST